MHWLLELGVFSSSDREFICAVENAGHSWTQWNDDWWVSKQWPLFKSDTVLFRGSLTNADRVRKELPWKPAAYRDTERFRCSAWYPAAGSDLLHEKWRLIGAHDLVESRREIAAEIGAGDTLFVRPDSPLKPFSGRVVPVAQISLATLDHGFYYEDRDLPVIVAPTRKIEDEYRFVVVGGAIVAGSGYVAEDRTPDASLTPDYPAWSYAGEVAGRLPSPEAVYVLDVVLGAGGYRLVELNPFSGADLYACDPAVVVAEIAALQV